MKYVFYVNDQENLHFETRKLEEMRISKFLGIDDRIIFIRHEGSSYLTTIS